MRLRPLIALLALWLIPLPAGAVMPESGWAGNDNLVNVAKLKASVSLIQGGKFDSAIRLLLQVVRSDPEDADGWTLLGYALRKTGNMRDAHEAYDKALELKPEHIYARQYLGEMLLIEGNLAGAQEQRAVIARECPGGCEPLTLMDQRLEEFRAKGLRPQG